jgi:hypothetical protein
MAKNGGKKIADSVTAKDVALVTSEKKLRALLKKARDCKKEMSGISGELGQAVANAVENDYLHRKAFSFCRQLDAMTDEKLAEYMTHLEHYLEVSGLNARVEKVSRLPLGDQPGETEGRPSNITRLQPQAAAAE